MSDSGAAPRRRMLMIMHMPWTRDLGAPRVSVELADEFRARGWEVDTYDLRAAFPRPHRLLGFFEWALFPYFAVRHVRRCGHRYDVIQAEQGNLPCSRERLGYAGVLVARSNGLAHFYLAWEREQRAEARRRGERTGSLGGNLLRSLARRLEGGERRIDRSLAAADVILVINREEAAYARETLGHGERVLLVPNGLSAPRRRELAAAAHPPRQRLAARRVVFIGHWAPRKGSRCFPELVRAVRHRVPDACFRLMGTHTDAGELLPLFAPEDRDALEVVPQFTSDQLPDLLAGGTVGVLPSMLEGFGLGVLEMLAAGIPTVAFDIPGPREMLTEWAEDCLAPLGDVEGLAARISRLLLADPGWYARRAEESRAIAARFDWGATADLILERYERIISGCERR